MKKSLFTVVIACLALFTSCGVSRINHTGDRTGAIYGVWALESKTIVPEVSSFEILSTCAASECWVYFR